MNPNTISLPWWARPTNLAIHPKFAIIMLLGTWGIYIYFGNMETTAPSEHSNQHIV